ncbi:MAG: lamin tail domain-containing protein, partial [Akkermansiaceae bacterium]|nr:lamin tail domain-containing protein [Akkermansiaceae bacterium]
HNSGTVAVDLGDHYLTNDAGDRTRWQFPEFTFLPAGGTIIVFASNKDRGMGELHTNFRLSKEAGGYLGLIDPDGR